MNKSLSAIIVIAAIAVGCSAISTEQKKKAAEHVKVCVDKIGVSSDDVLKIMGGDFSVTDTKIECFAKCFFEESGFMNADGDFLDNVAIGKLSLTDTNAEALVNTCKLRTGSNPCKTAYKMYQCYIEHKAF